MLRRRASRLFSRKKYVRRLLRRLAGRIIILKVAFSFGLIFSLFFSLSIMINTNSEISPPSVCYSKPCNDSAEFLLKSLNRSVDPCDNFHEFVCGNYMVSKYDLVGNEIEEGLIRQINLIDASEKSTNFEYLTKLWVYYKTCINDYYINIQLLKEKFDELGDYGINNQQNSSDRWEKVFHKFYAAGLNTDSLIDVEFISDPKNIKKRMIMFNMPGAKSRAIEINGKSIMNIIKVLEIKNVEQDIEEIIDFKGELTKLSLGNQRMVFDTIANLKSKFPKIQWLEFLNGILSPYVKLSDDTSVTYDMPYLERFYRFMTKNKPSTRALVNYLKWQNILNLGEENMFNSKQKYYGNFKRFLKNSIKKREKFCIQKMIDDMYLATSALYVEHIFNNNNTKMIQFISEKIRYSLYRNVEKVTWLSEEAKGKILNKISHIDLMIGYPPELLNRTIIEDYYRDLEVSTSQLFINQWNFQKFQRRKNAEKFAKPVNVKHWTGRFGKMTETSGMYRVENVVFVFGGMWHKLFVDVDIPYYMNFAMIGSLVGHEMAHALDDYYLHIDAEGNYVEDLWDKISNQKLMNKYKCLVEKYSNYTYPEFNLRVDGEKTLEENVADITGLKAAYDAYVSLMEAEPQEPYLSELEDFNAKQMFWIAYGSTFCSEKNNKSWIQDVLDTDIHAPEHYRVNGVVSSLSEFANDFNCEPTDLMNPIEKCPIWY